jgi:hypothetical protein
MDLKGVTGSPFRRKLTLLPGLFVLLALTSLLACRQGPDPAAVELQGSVSALSAMGLAQGTQIAALAVIELDNAAAVAGLHTSVAAQGTAIAGQNAQLADELREQEEMISYLLTRGPAPPIMDPNSTPTPFRPGVGSVVIDGGACCAGGVAGEIIELEAAFEATSTMGDEVTEMRARLGTVPFSEEELRDDEWGPFVEALYYPVELAVNWTRYHASVQYRDAAGNLSPVYYDDISVEGLQ